MEVEVRLVDQAEPTKIILRKYTAGERNQALRDAMKVKGNIGNPENSQMDMDYILFNELRIVASILSPKDMKSLDAIRTKLYPSDYDKLVKATNEINEVNPTTSTVSVTQ